MIQSFKDKDTWRFFGGVRISRFDLIAARAVRRLVVLDSAAALHDLAVLRGSRLETMRGDCADQYSIRINTRWLICFLWSDDGPWGIEIVDYH